MKKLNNKGFTLVELLAVIIILAIVVGISIPAITSVLNSSKNNAMGVALNAAEKHLVDQYALMNVDYNSASDNVKSAFPSTKISTTSKKQKVTPTAPLLTEMGLSTDNVTMANVELYIFDDGTACVVVRKIPTGSQYYTTTSWNADGSVITAKAEYRSKNCAVKGVA